MMSKNEKLKLIEYLHGQGLHLIPLGRGLKYPIIKGWPEYWPELSELKSAVNNGQGIGLIPDGKWCYIDIDTDHSGQADGLASFKELHMPASLVALKSGSDNAHVFYQCPHQELFRLTGNQAPAPGLEISSARSQVRVLNDYQFVNLDYSKSWMENLTRLPDGVWDNVLWLSKKHYAPVVDTHKIRTYHGASSPSRYLSKVPAPKSGERQSFYRSLCWMMVVKNRMDYDQVVGAIIDWDAENGVNFQELDPAGFEHALRNPAE